MAGKLCTAEHLAQLAAALPGTAGCRLYEQSFLLHATDSDGQGAICFSQVCLPWRAASVHLLLSHPGWH